MEYLADNWPILFLIFVYIALCLYVGWWFKRRASEGVSEYYIAKREIPGWVISLAFFSTFISTNTYIGQAGKAFQAGLSWAWVGLFWTIFCMFSWLLLGPRMRKQTANLNSVTIPDYFDYRYKSTLSKIMRAFAAFVIIFATLWYMVGIAKGCAHLLDRVLNVPYAWGAFLVIFITCAYTVWGGMYSVLWTDAIQGLMMFFVAIIMVILPAMYVGGWGELMSNISYVTHVTKAGKPMGDGLVTFCSLVSFMYILGIGLAVGMKQIAEPRCLIRFYSVDNAKSMKFAMIATPIFLGVSLICVMGLGALVHGMATEKEAAFLVKHTDQVIGFMLAKFGNPWISGICLAGLFAAGMSSLASVMLIVGTAFIGDMWNLFRPMDQEQIVPRTKITIVIYCAIVFLVTIFPPMGIVELTAFAGAVFASSFFPAIFGGLYLRWGTGHGAFWSMLIGMASCIIWRWGFRLNYAELKNIHEIIPSFIIALFVYVIISKMTQNKVPDKEHLDTVFGVSRV
jgi:SSS family transporter